MKSALFGSTFVLGLCMAFSAQASIFHLNFTNTQLPGNGFNGPFDVSATVNATWDGTAYEVTGIKGTVTEGSGSPGTYAITGPVSVLGTPPSIGQSPDGYFWFDNLIWKSGGKYSLDNAGLAFYANAPSDYANEPGTPPVSDFNLYGNGGQSYVLSTTASNNVNALFGGTMQIGVPEPVTLSVFGMGLFGAAAMIRRRKTSKAA
jgi:hypothetical protein